MTIIVCISLFLALMIAISLYGYRRYLRPARVYERLGRPVTRSVRGRQHHRRAGREDDRQDHGDLGNLMPVSPAGCRRHQRTPGHGGIP